MLTLSSILFYSGVVYIDKLIDFVDKIDNSIVQKETYYIVVLKENRIGNINSLNNKIIGYYNSESSVDNTNKAFTLLNKKITYEKKSYERCPAAAANAQIYLGPK